MPFEKGHKPWNTGLTKNNDKRWKLATEKIAKANKGQTPWNKGKTNIYTEETIKKIRLSRLANFETKEATNLYKQGKSCNDIAKILGCSHSAIWRRLSPLSILRDKSSSTVGKKPSQQALKNMQIAQQKRFSDPKERVRMQGKNNYFYGRKHKPKSIRIMKEKLSKLLSGKNNPQWRGGLSFEPYGTEFNKKLKQSIRQRDNFQCQECAKSQIHLKYKLLIHHIDYDKKNCSTNNLITLCVSCNAKANFNRDYWEKFYKQLIGR